MSLIQTFRKSQNLTQEQFGELLGVKKALVSKWEHGVKPSPRMAVELDEKTGGKLPRWMIRPDLWDAPPDTGAAQ